MARLVDRLQEMAAPPPPMAMQAAYRQQEQRRQKLFVGEYSMRDGTLEGPQKPKEGSITLMGTNPFRRTSRTIGVAAGGWSEKTPDASRRDESVSRMFPLYRSGAGLLRFRNTTSESVYHLAQHLPTNVVRSKLSKEDPATKSGSTASLWDAPTATTVIGDGDRRFMIWGNANDLCQIVLDGIENEKLERDPSEKGPSTPPVTVMTGLLRDMTDWIEHEDWERRLVGFYFCCFRDFVSTKTFF